jgi:7-keto-8-aminopelargonate synthetase-like enzyme
VTKNVSALGGSLLHFDAPEGADVESRVWPLTRWVDERRQRGVWPYSRVLSGRAGNRVVVADENLAGAREYLNYASQDYLGLASDQRILDAAHAAIDEFGVHSAGSPILAGRTTHGVALEAKIAALLGKESAMLFPTGWGAGFSAIAALVRGGDTIVIDALAHNCLQEGARHATRNVVRCVHNDVTSVERALKEARSRNAEGGVFLVTESLFSMDSDSPDLARLGELAREVGAFFILDVAHDFGSMGRTGIGLLEGVATGLMPDLIMGSFSKTFATNGGFIASSRRIREHVRFYGSPYIFSNAISPVQVAVASASFDIVFGDEGTRRRDALVVSVGALRDAMVDSGFEIIGQPSPIVPVFVGDEAVARLTSREMIRSGLQANLVEFPAVPRGRARFRFQVASAHGSAVASRAAKILFEARCLALDEVSSAEYGQP